MNLKKILLPPVFEKYNLMKYYHILFNKKKTIHLFKYERNFYWRVAFINKAVAKFKNCNYLELGVANNRVFNSIPLKMNKKFGVDPSEGGNFRMTSDEFFEKHQNLKFDVIFIDGLHHYDQCQKDCINSMKLLNPGGIIFLHDLLPRCEIEQVIPQSYSTWSGDVWKVAVELSHSTNVDFKICNIDHGLGILKLKNDFEYKKLDLKNATFDEYLNFKKDFNIINSEDALDFIEFEN
tara:strand:- start:344 stop:1051 length:708 start_codon:yes stop_codon:yes gene_type:complete